MQSNDLYKKILLKQKFISEADAVAAQEYEKSKKGTFIDYLMNNELLSRSTLGLAVAEYYGVTYVDISNRATSRESILQIPEKIAKANRIVFIESDADRKEVQVATDKPDNKTIKKTVHSLFPKYKIQISYAFPEDIEKALSFYGKKLDTKFSEIAKREKGVATEIFNAIVLDALLYNASDIHFEPHADGISIRFRVDGMLRSAGLVSKELYESLLNKIKIQANLRTDEHFAPQDGAIRFVVKDKVVDLRVSVVPVIEGEKVVVRVLTEYIEDLNFNSLGFSEAQIEMMSEFKDKTYGMVIVTGPTGSGKTTTLYSFLKEMNTPEVNITTIEDPVEYYMPGTNQIQVNKKTDLNFVKGLRSIVRQDPDVILLGEIRDQETADTAVNASLTGHLLLSTFHANNSATAILRLLDMNVEPFLLSSTLELIISQRLARKICTSCKHSYSQSMKRVPKELSQIKKIESADSVTLYKGKGCEACNHTGYSGRTAIVEMIRLDKKIKELINKNPTEEEILKLAYKNGFESMFEDGYRKAKLGLTTVEEIMRISELPGK